MIGLLIAGVSVSASALFWRTIVVPFDRLLQLSQEEDHPDWKIGGEAETAAPVGHSMTESLARLSASLNQAPKSVAEQHSTTEILKYH